MAYNKKQAGNWSLIKITLLQAEVNKIAQFCLLCYSQHVFNFFWENKERKSVGNKLFRFDILEAIKSITLGMKSLRCRRGKPII